MLDFFRCTQKAAPYLKDTRRHKNEPFLEKGNIISFVRSIIGARFILSSPSCQYSQLFYLFRNPLSIDETEKWSSFLK